MESHIHGIVGPDPRMVSGERDAAGAGQATAGIQQASARPVVGGSVAAGGPGSHGREQYYRPHPFADAGEAGSAATAARPKRGVRAEIATSAGRLAEAAAGGTR